MRATPHLILDKFSPDSFARQWNRGVWVLLSMALMSGMALALAWKAYQPRSESALFLKQANNFSLSVEKINTQTISLLYAQLRAMSDYRLQGEGALADNSFSMMQLQGASKALVLEIADIKILLSTKFWDNGLDSDQQKVNRIKLQKATEEVSLCLAAFELMNRRLITELRNNTQTSFNQQAQTEVQLQRKSQQLTQAVKKLADQANQHAIKVLDQASQDDQWLLKGIILCSALAFLWNGGLLYLLGRSLKSNATLLKEMSTAASLDPLTGLLNRRALEQQIAVLNQKTLDRRKKVSTSGNECCLMLIDLDFFKKYNDTYGHIRGDAHLKACAAVWRNGIRGNDVLARMGGEEFAVVMPNCTEMQAYATAQRLQQAMPAGTTFSAGISLGLPNEVFEVWYERADQALYLAKSKGRARTELAGIQTSIQEPDITQG
jgi:diguanylate cyclase (GGDEF)-like protein